MACFAHWLGVVHVYAFTKCVSSDEEAKSVCPEVRCSDVRYPFNLI